MPSVARDTAHAELQFPPVQPDIPFTADEYRERLRRLQEAMAAARVDLLLLSSPEAMCWLHGFRARWYKTGSTTAWPPLALTAVPLEETRFICFDDESHETLWKWSSISSEHRWLPERDLDENLGRITSALRDERWLHGTVGVERWSPTPNAAAAMALQEALEGHGCKVLDATPIVRGARRVKSSAELAMIEHAAAVCDVGHRRLQEVIAPGVTELEAWGEMMLAMSRAGGEHGGLHELVWSGVGLGHGVSSTRRLSADGPVYADPSGSVYRYHANICRTYWLGEPPTELLRRGNAFAGAIKVLCDVATPGTAVRDVNRAMREYYIDAGLWDLNRWVGGYELGIAFPPDWVGEFVFSCEQEEPEGVIEAGMVTNFEHLLQGISMIDTVVYGSDGTRTLSALPREVIAIDR